jgi:hypothetical protein
MTLVQKPCDDFWVSNRSYYRNFEMNTSIFTRFKSDRRIHKAYDFLEKFYLNRWKERLLYFALGVAVASIVGLTWAFSP